MQTIQRRRERENRQINERLRTLIAVYKPLGGSFTGKLDVDPTHLRDLRDLRERAEVPSQDATDVTAPGDADLDSDRRRRIRDAVEAELSDVILLGTEEQVQLAAEAASDMAAGHPVRTSALVVSLRAVIRKALDLEAIPGGVVIPDQGPSRSDIGGSKKSGPQGGGGGGGGAMGGGTGTGMSQTGADSSYGP